MFVILLVIFNIEKLEVSEGFLVFFDFMLFFVYLFLVVFVNISV